METIEKTKVCIYSVQTANYTIREETLNGAPHIVVPVVMMVEGVHHGSGGPIFHRAAELSRFTESWNGVPVTISHPTVEEDGEEINVSANSPEVLNESTVGRIFNTIYRGGLRAECWIDVEKISVISPVALEHIRSGEPLDVSIGVFSDTDDTEGEWRGEPYESIATSYRPDHLALLPGEAGACSWADGCGIRINKKGGNVDDLLKSFRELSLKGYVVNQLTDNVAGFQEISSLLQGKLNAMDTNSRMFFLEEVYTDTFIYRVRDTDGGSTLYRRGYTANAGEVELAENSVEVRKQVEFVVMKMTRRAKPDINLNNKGGKMSAEETLCCEAKVDELIVNKQTHWQATDREWLLTLKESVIAKMSPMVPEVVEQTAEEIQANNAKVIEDYNKGKKTVEDFTADMPEAMKAQVDGGVKLYKEHRETLVKGIMDNAKDVWKEDILNAMDDGTLENVSKSITKPVDYSALGAGGGEENASGEQVEVPIQYRKRKEDE